MLYLNDSKSYDACTKKDISYRSVQKIAIKKIIYSLVLFLIMPRCFGPVPKMLHASVTNSEMKTTKKLPYIL